MQPPSYETPTHMRNSLPRIQEKATHRAETGGRGRATFAFALRLDRLACQVSVCQSKFARRCGERSTLQQANGGLWPKHRLLFGCLDKLGTRRPRRKPGDIRNVTLAG